MNHCSICNYENQPTSTFCGRCGASLASSSSPLEPTSFTPNNTMLPVAIPPPPPPSSYERAAIVPQERTSHKRTLRGTLLSLLYYLWGVFWVAYGVVGGLLYSTASVAGVGLIFIFCCLAGLVVLIPVLLYRKQFRIQWWLRLLLEIGLLFTGVVLLAVFHSSPQRLGIVCLLYGLATAFVAFW